MVGLQDIPRAVLRLTPESPDCYSAGLLTGQARNGGLQLEHQGTEPSIQVLSLKHNGLHIV